MLPPPYHHGNTIINPVPVPSPSPSPSPVPNAFAKEKEKGIVKGEEKTKKQTEPVIAEMLTEIKAFLGYPDKTNQDPIPNYAKEGQFLKKILGRHFTREEILSCRKTKVQQRRGEFISLAWVNEDIAGFAHSRDRSDGNEKSQVAVQQDPVRAMQAAGWNTEEGETDEPGK